MMSHSSPLKHTQFARGKQSSAFLISVLLQAAEERVRFGTGRSFDSARRILEFTPALRSDGKHPVQSLLLFSLVLRDSFRISCYFCLPTQRSTGNDLDATSTTRRKHRFSVWLRHHSLPGTALPCASALGGLRACWGQCLPLSRWQRGFLCQAPARCPLSLPARCAIRYDRREGFPCIICVTRRLTREILTILTSSRMTSTRMLLAPRSNWRRFFAPWPTG